MKTKWKSAGEAFGGRLQMAAAMTDGKGTIRYPNNDMARVRAMLALDLEECRRYIAEGAPLAGQFVMGCARQERIFILTGKA